MFAMDVKRDFRNAGGTRVILKKVYRPPHSCRPSGFLIREGISDEHCHSQRPVAKRGAIRRALASAVGHFTSRFRGPRLRPVGHPPLAPLARAAADLAADVRLPGAAIALRMSWS